MQHVLLAKAKPGGSSVIESCHINITENVPDFGSGFGWDDKAHEFYENEAERLADALLASLPGGTVDQLLVELLCRKASLLCVPLES